MDQCHVETLSPARGVFNHTFQQRPSRFISTTEPPKQQQYAPQISLIIPPRQGVRDPIQRNLHLHQLQSLPQYQQQQQQKQQQHLILTPPRISRSPVVPITYLPEANRHTQQMLVNVNSLQNDSQQLKRISRQLPHQLQTLRTSLATQFTILNQQPQQQHQQQPPQQQPQLQPQQQQQQPRPQPHQQRTIHQGQVAPHFTPLPTAFIRQSFSPLSRPISSSFIYQKASPSQLHHHSPTPPSHSRNPYETQRQPALTPEKQSSSVSSSSAHTQIIASPYVMPFTRQPPPLQLQPHFSIAPNQRQSIQTLSPSQQIIPPPAAPFLLSAAKQTISMPPNLPQRQFSAQRRPYEFLVDKNLSSARQVTPHQQPTPLLSARQSETSRGFNTVTPSKLLPHMQVSPIRQQLSSVSKTCTPTYSPFPSARSPSPSPPPKPSSHKNQETQQRRVSLNQQPSPLPLNTIQRRQIVIPHQQHPPKRLTIAHESLKATSVHSATTPCFSASQVSQSQLQFFRGTAAEHSPNLNTSTVSVTSFAGQINNNNIPHLKSTEMPVFLQQLASVSNELLEKNLLQRDLDESYQQPNSWNQHITLGMHSSADGQVIVVPFPTDTSTTSVTPTDTVTVTAAVTATATATATEATPATVTASIMQFQSNHTDEQSLQTPPRYNFNTNQTSASHRSAQALQNEGESANEIVFEEEVDQNDSKQREEITVYVAPVTITPTTITTSTFTARQKYQRNQEANSSESDNDSTENQRNNCSETLLLQPQPSPLDHVNSSIHNLQLECSMPSTQRQSNEQQRQHSPAVEEVFLRDSSLQLNQSSTSLRSQPVRCSSSRSQRDYPPPLKFSHRHNKYDDDDNDRDLSGVVIQKPTRFSTHSSSVAQHSISRSFVDESQVSIIASPASNNLSNVGIKMNASSMSNQSQSRNSMIKPEISSLHAYPSVRFPHQQSKQSAYEVHELSYIENETLSQVLPSRHSEVPDTVIGIGLTDSMESSPMKRQSDCANNFFTTKSCLRGYLVEQSSTNQSPEKSFNDKSIRLTERSQVNRREQDTSSNVNISRVERTEGLLLNDDWKEDTLSAAQIILSSKPRSQSPPLSQVSSVASYSKGGGGEEESKSNYEDDSMKCQVASSPNKVSIGSLPIVVAAQRGSMSDLNNEMMDSIQSAKMLQTFVYFSEENRVSSNSDNEDQKKIAASSNKLTQATAHQTIVASRSPNSTSFRRMEESTYSDCNSSCTNMSQLEKQINLEKNLVEDSLRRTREFRDTLVQLQRLRKQPASDNYDQHHISLTLKQPLYESQKSFNNHNYSTNVLPRINESQEAQQRSHSRTDNSIDLSSTITRRKVTQTLDISLTEDTQLHSSTVNNTQYPYSQNQRNETQQVPYESQASRSELLASRMYGYSEFESIDPTISMIERSQLSKRANLSFEFPSKSQQGHQRTTSTAKSLREGEEGECDESQVSSSRCELNTQQRNRGEQSIICEQIESYEYRQGKGSSQTAVTSSTNLSTSSLSLTEYLRRKQEIILQSRVDGESSESFKSRLMKLVKKVPVNKISVEEKRDLMNDDSLNILSAVNRERTLEESQVEINQQQEKTQSLKHSSTSELSEMEFYQLRTVCEAYLLEVAAEKKKVKKQYKDLKVQVQQHRGESSLQHELALSLKEAKVAMNLIETQRTNFDMKVYAVKTRSEMLENCKKYPLLIQEGIEKFNITCERILQEIRSDSASK